MEARIAPVTTGGADTNHITARLFLVSHAEPNLQTMKLTRGRAHKDFRQDSL